jgi:hypothetical protein
VRAVVTLRDGGLKINRTVSAPRPKCLRR